MMFSNCKSEGIGIQDLCQRSQQWQQKGCELGVLRDLSLAPSNALKGRPSIWIDGASGQLGVNLIIRALQAGFWVYAKTTRPKQLIEQLKQRGQRIDRLIIDNAVFLPDCTYYIINGYKMDALSGLGAFEQNLKQAFDLWSQLKDRLDQVMLISTLSIFVSAPVQVPVKSLAVDQLHHRLIGGYAQSKVMIEQWFKGSKIMRLTLLTDDVANGIKKDSFFYQYIEGIKKIGIGSTASYIANCIPVNLAARALFDKLHKPAGVYHISGQDISASLIAHACKQMEQSFQISAQCPCLEGLNGVQKQLVKASFSDTRQLAVGGKYKNMDVFQATGFTFGNEHEIKYDAKAYINEWVKKVKWDN